MNLKSGSVLIIILRLLVLNVQDFSLKKYNQNYTVQKYDVNVSNITELRKQPGKIENVIKVNGYYQQNDCPPFEVTWVKSTNNSIKDDGVIWFYANNDKSGNSGFWKRKDLQSIDIRQTGAIGDIKKIETAKTKIVAVADGKTANYSFALQERVKPGTYKIIYTDKNDKIITVNDVDYGDETGLLVSANEYKAGITPPVGLVYYLTGRVEGAELGEWGIWMKYLTATATVNKQSATTKNQLLNTYNKVQPQHYTDLLTAALNVKPVDCKNEPSISPTRYYTSLPTKTDVSPFDDSMFEPSYVLLPSVPKAKTAIKVQYTKISYTGTYTLPDGRTNTQAIQTALNNISKLIIPSITDLQKTSKSDGTGFFLNTCFVPANRIIEGSGKNTSAKLQFYYDTTNSYQTKWLKATINKNGLLQFIQPEIKTASGKSYTGKDQVFNRDAASANLYIFSNKSTGDSAGNIIFRGLNLVGIGETLGPQYYDCYWDLDRRYQDVLSWNHEKINSINEPARLSQHNINIVEAPNVIIEDCESDWALEDGAYFSTYTGWQDYSTFPDYKSTTINIGAVKNIKISNSNFLYNGRNGTFVTSGKNIIVNNNFYNYDQLGCLFDRPGQPQNFPSGSLAFEEHSPEQYLEKVIITNNRVSNSFGQAGHFLGKGKGIDSFIHQSNIYRWDYADWYTPIDLLRTAIMYGTRIMNLSDTKNVVINSPALGLLMQLDPKRPNLCINNVISQDTIYNCGRHAIEIKHSPDMKFNDCVVDECGWRAYTGQKINALVSILGNTSGQVKNIKVENIRKPDQSLMQEKPADNLTPKVQNN